MIRYNKTSLTYMMQKNVFEDTEIVKVPSAPERLGFNVAFGIIDVDTYKAVEEIEKMGKFKAKKMSWNVIEKEFGKVEEIPIHRCTDEDRKKFYKPNKIY